MVSLDEKSSSPYSLVASLYRWHCLHSSAHRFHLYGGKRTFEQKTLQNHFKTASKKYISLRKQRPAKIAGPSSVVEGSSHMSVDLAVFYTRDP